MRALSNQVVQQYLRKSVSALSLSLSVAGSYRQLSVESTASSAATGLPLQFIAEATYLPAREKVKNGGRGEDAFFITKHAVGVADGVGGWADEGIDAGVYSRKVMELAEAFCTNAQLTATPEKGVHIDPLEALAYAGPRVKDLGSSTAVIASVGADGYLRVRNLGDSGLMVWRHSRALTLHAPVQLNLAEAKKLWKLELQTKSQTWAFNSPFQMGTNGNPVDAAEAYTFKPKPADLVLLATDGLFDNLFLDDILSAIAKLDYKPVHEFVRLKMRRMKEDRAEVGAIEQLKIRNVAQDQVTDAELQHAEKAARTVLRSMSALLAVSAQTVGEKPTGDTPFSKEAPTKWKYEGGKPDDVVVLLGVVIPDVDA